VLHLDDGFDLRPASAADASVVAAWMVQPHIFRWWEQDWSEEKWAQTISEQVAGEHTIPCMISADGEDFGYVELYRVRLDRLAEYYAWEEHDWGLHIAIGDTARLGRGLGRRLLRSLADALLRADTRCDRIVAEPDITNHPSIRAFTAAGFVTQAELQLPEKTALLMVRQRTVEV
jgi:RimJ/RimL family protein N-acetyltransferase